MRTAVIRKRGKALQQERDAWFTLHPLCVHCLEAHRTRKAVELDHKVPLFKGGKDVPSNKQGLCKPCHKAKTLQDMGHKPRERIGLDGFAIVTEPSTE